MKAFTWPLLWSAVLVSWPRSSLAANPTIDVTLQASFTKAPFLLELLETAALEHPPTYRLLLEHIASGSFSNDATDEVLYKHFLRILQSDGILTDSAALSSFELAVSIHAAAPRIEAHFQFYQASVQATDLGESGEQCEASIWQDGKHLCFTVGGGEIRKSRSKADHSVRNLGFDRPDKDMEIYPSSTLYADILSPHFSEVYREWRNSQQDGIAYRLRYKPSKAVHAGPLVVSGYGVELALKRTDYIVIDDREAGQGSDAAGQANEIDEVTDLKPLSSSDLQNLGLKASCYIMDSDDPFATLLGISQDFPKHSAALTAQNVSGEFVTEHKGNRESMLPEGLNALWINGVQIDDREVDAFSLLEHLRRERKLIDGFMELGFTPPEAISILSHPAHGDVQQEYDIQRYNFRDEKEGGNVILWMNDLEKDSRYADWPREIQALLQRMYPGQLPRIRKDIHNLVIPTDFTNPKQVTTVVESLKGIVQRMVPLRIGLVPSTFEPRAVEQAKVVYYLNEAYGLATVMEYLETSLAGKTLLSADQKTFDSAVAEKKLRKGRQNLDLASVLQSGALQERVSSARRWNSRLSADGANTPIFINGIALPRGDDWLQRVSEKVGSDLRIVQQNVFEETITEDAWIPYLFLEHSSLKRNPLIIPEDENDVKLIDISKLFVEHGDVIERLPIFQLAPAPQLSESASLMLMVDVNSDAGRQLFLNAVEHANEHDGMEITVIHTSNEAPLLPASLAELMSLLDNSQALPPDRRAFIIKAVQNALSQENESGEREARLVPHSLLASLKLNPGQHAILLNGRLLGPLQQSEIFDKEDFETLLDYERKKRMLPVSNALEGLEWAERVTTALQAAKIFSLVALATVSDMPEGVFETPRGPRLSAFTQWKDRHTAIKKGDISTSTVQVVASIDPASETAQRWLPILRVLSDLYGVHTQIFLNPRSKMDELPIKRFYRHVLEAKPIFDDSGALKDLQGHFEGIPTETLLTMTMDVPPSWLVAPKESIYDLDNIKLSALKGQGGIEAVYELEHILIEGHARDLDAAPPPRGVQLLLGTEADANFAGTIIMANLGYFQFKANPGVYNLALQEGRSRQIYNIDSAGTLGHSPHPGDNTTEISLTSFQGVTLFPRLSRKHGQEEEDVLEPAKGPVAGLVDMCAASADSLLDKAGLPHIRSGPLISKAIGFGQSFLSKTGLSNTAQTAKHADINIFSVASGHLYERMLNIMMVSVMRHTRHTVKFWFIEQFLSPSFKSSLPTLAAEYKFEFEMVTFKWPHWLRAQKEKQRVIWGYKILFLDVLFPLDLDKVIFVDADQIVRTDMYELVTHDLEGAPYGFTPMCDSRTEMEGFRFWKQGYWKTFLRGLPYHISALYVVDLKRFRQMAAGDRLRQQYHALSRDPGSLANLDQDLPNHMQMSLRIHSLPQDWLWCETWCSDSALATAKTIDLCNNPQTKEPKLDRARRQVPEWTEYDEEIAALMEGTKHGVPPPSASSSSKDEL